MRVAGILGSDSNAMRLAAALAARGIKVKMYDVFKDNLKMARARLEWLFREQAYAAYLSNAEMAQDINGLKDADIIIDSGAELSQNRFELFRKISYTFGEHIILALKCGVAPISEFAAEMKHKERFVGFNFCSPADINPVAEVVRMEFTDDKTAEEAVHFLRFIGKIPIVISDMAGAVVERLRCPFILSATSLLEAGKGRIFQIDRAIKKTGALSVGPFEMADIVGVDKFLESNTEIYNTLKTPARLKPAAPFERLAKYGHLGRKNGLGFYIYEGNQIVGENPALKEIVHYLGISSFRPEDAFVNVLCAVHEEAEILANEAGISKFDIDTAVKYAFGWPKGPVGMYKEKEDLIVQAKNRQKDMWGDSF